ncbi:hypothetical protein WJX74_002044 [Apatococcus lobatus]|uniref:Large ribosomal subunit protein uL30m n=1 Tax=Apatococcus lobatus TaxID=904363 RepID=A0AAW1QVG6_9CHLO
MPEPVRKLWVTLHRSFAGTKATHIKTAQALGFSKLQQTIAHPNTPSVRGAVDKIKHLVRVETDIAREARLAAAAAAAAPKSPAKFELLKRKKEQAANGNSVQPIAAISGGQKLVVKLQAGVPKSNTKQTRKEAIDSKPCKPAGGVKQLTAKVHADIKPLSGKELLAGVPRPSESKAKADPMQAAIQAMAAKKAQAARKASWSAKGKVEEVKAQEGTARGPKRPSLRKPAMERKQAAAEPDSHMTSLPGEPASEQASSHAAPGLIGHTHSFTSPYSPTAGQAYSPSDAHALDDFGTHAEEPAAKRHHQEPPTPSPHHQDIPLHVEPSGREHWPHACPTLHVGNLPAEWMEEDLRAIFENFNVTRISLRHDKKCAFLDLATEEDLMLCLGSLDSNPIQVDGPEPGQEDPMHLRSYLQVSRARNQQQALATRTP